MTDEPPAAEATTPDRSLLVIGLGVVALVVAAVIAVVLLGSRDAEAFPADSPEGVLQRHLAAVEAEDYEAAWSYFSAEVQSDVSVDEYRRMARDYGYWGTGSRRILFDGSEVDGERARVRLTVEEYYDGGPFSGANTFRSTREIALVREGGEWRIDEPLIGLEPMPFPEY